MTSLPGSISTSTATSDTARARALRRRLGTAMAAVIPVIALMEALYYFGGLTGTRDDTPLRAVAVTTVVGAVAAFAVWRLGARGMSDAEIASTLGE